MVEENSKREEILVISSETELAQMVQEAVAGSIEVVHAPDEQQGLEKARKDMPDIIALGYIEPRGSAFRLHRQLKEGWITKNIPLLIIDVNPRDPSRRVLSMEEGLQIEADEFIALAGSDERAAAARLAEPIVRLRERLSEGTGQYSAGSNIKSGCILHYVGADSRQGCF